MNKAINKSEVIVQSTNKKLADKRLSLLLEKIYTYHDLMQRIPEKRVFPNPPQISPRTGRSKQVDL